ncbi:S-protein homolog 5-like [Mercurialis annua]|uniref:S-protein homolog 5-like n=1 Tax=Mercurialis annua TaxID=3986 RepID=UPI0021603E62|nr:S-protein homolog 5-like [Mercurialis annua]
MSSFISRKQYYCLLLLCLLKLAIAYHYKVHVYIANDVGKDVDLTVHCKSKDDDLGVHLLHDQETYQFSFHRNVWGTTLFYCKFTWSDQLKWFDIFVEDKYFCQDCYWKIKADGPCLQDIPITCFEWNK